ncbi:MAG: glutamate 5-kinase [Nitrospirae bacterium]|nr:glutamate 5-kinase [Nitrospirota bacterium]
MIESDRKRLMKGVRRVVVKVGSGIITSRSHGLIKERFAAIAAQVARAVGDGREVILVSSGAVAAGVAAMSLRELHGIPMRQAAAAVGQSRLIWKYEKHFQEHRLGVAQVLLTQDDVANRRRFLNARNTFATLLALGIIPIVNENDSVVVEEIKFGDNDTLSGLVATLVDADLLLILSDVDGLYTADPKRDPDARLIGTVQSIDDTVRAMATGPTTREGTGGMITKLRTAQRLADLGIPTLLVNGTLDDGLTRALAGDKLGTLFEAAGVPKAAKKHWLAHVARVDGVLHLDAGAVAALRDGKKSLLPSGITAVEGHFEMGEGVSCVGPDGREVARGLTNYGAADVARIKGKKSSEIEAILGQKAYDEVIHRDNLTVL